MKFDTGDFDRAVEKMQQKLKEISNLSKSPTPGQPAAPAQGATTAGTGDASATKPGMEAFFKQMNALRTNQNQAMQSHAKEQMRLMKDIAKEEEKRGKLIQDQEKISKNKTKNLQEELRIKKELQKTEEQISRLSGQASGNQSSFLQARVAAGQTQPVFVMNWPSGQSGDGQGGGGGKGPGGGGGAGGNKKFWGGLGKSLGSAAALLATGATLIDQYTSLPLTRTGALGSATQSLVGGNLQEIANGNVVSSMGWMKEKQRAAEMASAKFQSQMVTSPMNVLGGAISLGKSALGGGGGAGQDANANYLVGTITKALSAVFSVSMKGSMADHLSESLGKASESYFSTHQAQLMEDFGKNYESMLSAQQKENPLKNLAINYMQDRYKTDLQAQRMMGMTDDQLYGRKGFMEQANQAGFTGDMRLQMAQQIEGAGGSTRGAKGNSLLGLQAQRGFDMTNAGSVLGTISSGVGGAEASERIFKRILTEGVKNGLDGSNAVEELRRFSQQTAEIVAKTGAITGADTSRIMENFSRFQNTGAIPTIKEQEGSKAAYQEYQNFSAETGGRGGAMQFAAMVKHGLSKIGPKAMGSLMEMPEEDLTETNDRVVSIAARYGMSPKELVDKTIKAKQEKADTEVGFNPKYRETLQNAGVTGKLTYEELQQQTPEVREAYEESRMATTAKSQYTTAQKAEAASLRFQRGGVTEAGTTAAGAGVTERLDQAPGTRAADDVTKSAGVAAQAMLENFRDFKKEITPAADALDAFTKRLVILTQVMSMTPEADRAAAAKYVGEKLFTPINQQAGKPPSR